MDPSTLKLEGLTLANKGITLTLASNPETSPILVLVAKRRSIRTIAYDFVTFVHIAYALGILHVPWLFSIRTVTVQEEDNFGASGEFQSSPWFSRHYTSNYLSRK
ncbi:transmembrane protein, putative [Medicago truncatula]|uniref:Transmembrane protein, putative n=1 Tax=Medicago truncatula TaxID=3880 RepID=A0A072U308_MEDTR|nr:transmembrane protein, putative [Medicago truncatula]